MKKQICSRDRNKVRAASLGGSSGKVFPPEPLLALGVVCGW